MVQDYVLSEVAEDHNKDREQECEVKKLGGRLAAGLRIFSSKILSGNHRAAGGESCEDIDDEKKLGEAIAGSDLLINATRAGMSPLENVLPVPEELLHKDLAVADVVYNPRETLLIKKAKEAGCKAAVGGIGMLLWQGAAAFELFTGKEMPAQEVMELFFS